MHCRINEMRAEYSAPCFQQLSLLANELDSRSFLAVDLDIGKCGNADKVNTNGSKISSCNCYSLYCLISSTAFCSLITPAIAPATEFGDECDDTFKISMIITLLIVNWYNTPIYGIV